MLKKSFHHIIAVLILFTAAQVSFSQYQMYYAYSIMHYYPLPGYYNKYSIARSGENELAKKAVVIRNASIETAGYEYEEASYDTSERYEYTTASVEESYFADMTPPVSSKTSIGVPPHGYKYYVEKPSSYRPIRDFRVSLWLSNQYAADDYDHIAFNEPYK
ncbi:MAG: hypothetical protein L0Y79_06135 [Chlorobi bacterium]|nr:hypothetical protein [Chlorobiota bacterium]MCI0716094.1 hypothetical protein [Chlorobiota bacterium]